MPDVGIEHAVNFLIKVHRAFKYRIGSARVIGVKLLHGNTVLLDCVFFLDTGTENVRFVHFDKGFRFMVADVIDNQGTLGHVGNHALILFELKTLLFQGLHLPFGLSGVVPGLIGFDFQLLNVSGVCINLDIRNDLTSFIVVPVGKLVSGGEHFHAQIPEQFLVVMGTRTTHKHHGCFTLAPGFDLFDLGFNRDHLLGNHLFHRVDKFLVFKVGRNLAQTLGG